jgi:hypothetical protein
VADDLSFGGWLATKGLLTKDGLRRARDAQRGRLGRLDTEILDLQLMSEAAVLDALGKFHNTRTVSGSELEFASPAAVRMLTPRIASRLGVVPFKIEGKTLSVATLSPGDLLVEDEIAQQTGFMVASFVTLEIRFVEALNRHYRAPITARYAGLIKRLSGQRETRETTAAHSAERELVHSPEPGYPADRDRRRGERRRPPVRPVVEEELELSTEELDLFPSLREDHETADEKTAGLAGAVALARDRSGPIAKRSEPVQAHEPGPAQAAFGAEDLLEAASLAMQNVEMRDDIADAMLGFCAPLFRRRMMLVRRGDTIIGWRGEGAGVDEQVVRAVSIPTGELSVFSGLLQGVEFWLGPLPPMPQNTELVVALGGSPPKDCFILPVRVRDKVVCFLYGDNQGDGVGGPPLGLLKRLAAKAGIAFQIYLMKGKIRAS